MTKHIAVPEELLKELFLADETENDHAYYRVLDKLRALLDGPGVEPVATLVEPPLDSMKDNFWMTEEDAIRLSKLPYGTKLYLTAPSAPVQAVPDGWLEQYDIFIKDYRRYVAGDASMPFSVLRMSLAAFLEECEKLAAAPQPPATTDKENGE